MSDNSNRVFLAVIVPDDGHYHRTAHTSRDDADTALVSWAREHWGDDELPADPQEVLREYKSHTDDELYVIEFDVDFYVGDTVAVVHVVGDDRYGEYGYEVFADHDAAVKAVADHARDNWRDVIEYADYHTFDGVRVDVPLTAPDNDAEAFDLYWRVAFRQGDVAEVPVLDHDTSLTVYAPRPAMDETLIIEQLDVIRDAMDSRDPVTVYSAVDVLRDHVNSTVAVETEEVFEYPRYAEGVHVI
jgi:hypothetical protein